MLASRTSLVSNWRSWVLPLGSPMEPGGAARQRDGMMAQQLKPAQRQQRHQVAHVQAVGGRVEPAVEGDRARADAFGQLRRVRAIRQQPAPLEFFQNVHRRQDRWPPANFQYRLSLSQHRGQVSAGVAGRASGDGFGRALRDDLAAGLAAFRAEINDPIGGLDDVQVVLDDDEGVAGGAELEEHFEQLGDVVEVQAGGGLVEDVERAAGRFAAQLGGELDALGLAAAEGGGGLAEANVAQADFAPA